jgi:hypothetical protein
MLNKLYGAPVAQLDRASDFGSEGCRFESCQVRHSPRQGQRQGQTVTIHFDERCRRLMGDTRLNRNVRGAFGKAIVSVCMLRMP